jgi:hypothetical protein
MLITTVNGELPAGPEELVEHVRRLYIAAAAL